MKRIAKIPTWVWLIIVALAAIQPLLHLGIRMAPPEGTVPTGLHIPDSALFLYSMDMFASDFNSRYATCQSAVGDHHVTLYAVPHLWLYGALGILARILHANPFLFYGFANGVGVFLYLLAIYGFLRQVVPRFANRAFLLFALSGGLGGILYLITGLFGLHDHPEFATYFSRFAFYELMEGPHLNPILYAPRFYYTLSLALCFGAFTALLKALERDYYMSLWCWSPLLALGSFVYARFAIFTFGLVVLYLLLNRDCPAKKKRLLGLWYAASVALGCGPAYLLMRTNPAVVENHVVVGNMAMWFSPFVVVTWLHLLLSRRAVFRSLTRLPAPAAVAALAGIGYLTAYTVLYLAYQLYHGNLLAGRDGSVAANISDVALLGAILGAAVIIFRPKLSTPHHPHDWILLWLVGYLAISLSGFGGGWFLRFGPQRLEVFLWLPLCIFAAIGLTKLTPKRTALAMTTLLVSGITAIAVAAFAFQAPLGRTDARGPYPEFHPEIMTNADDELLGYLEGGTVLTTAPMADVVVLQRGNPVVFGIGSFNLTDQSFLTLSDDIETFFRADTPAARRQEIARQWCASYVLCPDTWPIDKATRTQLQNTPWLDQIAVEGNGLLFRVM